MTDQSDLTKEITKLLNVLANYVDDGDRSQMGYHRYYESAGYAAKEIEEMGADALEGLLHNLNDSNPKVRKEAVTLLGKIDDDSVSQHLSEHLEIEDDATVKQQIQARLRSIERRKNKRDKPKPKATKPTPEPEEKQSLFSKLIDIITGDDDDDTPEVASKPTAKGTHVRRCMICSKQIEPGDTMISERGQTMRSSGVKSQVTGAVFCSRGCYNTFKDDPVSWR